MSSLRNIILLVALLAAGVAGYFVGARSGQDAKEALAKLEDATKAGEAEHKKTTAELQAQVTSLTAKYDAAKQQADAGDKLKRDQLSALLAAREKTIADLKARRSSELGEIERLRLHLNDAQSPQEKQALLDQIARLKDEVKAAGRAEVGQKCLDVAVPKDMLETLRGDKS
jgi:hypothetical protein